MGIKLPTLETVQYKPIEVQVKNNNIDKALQLLKRKVKESGLLVELRERQYYKKPSAIRREKKAKAKIRNKYRNINDN